MNKQLLYKLYERRGLPEEETQNAIDAVLLLEGLLKEKGFELDNAPLEEIKVYIEELAQRGDSDSESMLALSRYFYLIGRKDIYLYLAQVTGGIGVIDNIKSRVQQRAGKIKTNKVFESLAEPPLGTPQQKRPEFIRALMARLKANLDTDSIKEILAGNNHGIPAKSMEQEKKDYENAASLDEYLEQRHARKVAELQRFCDNDEVWFEQIISQGVVDFVAANQEILSAVKKGNKLYVTKIPYDIINYLDETDPKLKRYYGCHCPFVRENILSDEEAVSAQWCYCSAGFAKFPFEEILGRELKVELIKSVLAGDEVCRFAIDIS